MKLVKSVYKKTWVKKLWLKKLIQIQDFLLILTSSRRVLSTGIMNKDRGWNKSYKIQITGEFLLLKVNTINWKRNNMKANLIAPCGMNCAICLGYLRDKNKCLGCREMSKDKPESCRKCIIVHCEILKENKMLFCSDTCKKFPCTRLKNLDKRYRTKYGMSMLDNLKHIRIFGIIKFIKSEQKRWKCPKCGDLLCVHRDFCLKCGDHKKQSR